MGEAFMKKKLLIAVILLIALALFTSHYSLIERHDELPAQVQSFVDSLTGTAYAAEAEQDYILSEVLQPRAFLETGDSGEAVRTLQERLYSLGFTSNTADGIFGEQTEGAVSALKSYLRERLSERAEQAEARRVERLKETRASLEAQRTGHDAQAYALGQAALEEMSRVLQPSVQEEPVREEGYTAGVSRQLWELLNQEDFLTGEASLSTGASSSRVTRLQRRLKSLNYLSGEADGVLGADTQLALTAFQKFNGLKQSGQADAETQRVLYSSSALAGKQADKRYLLKISVDKQRVYAYEWSVLDQDYTSLARTMVCSTGLNATPTPKGTFTNTTPVVRWGYFPKFDCWAQYLYRINGSILFHSVLYDSAEESTLRWGSVQKLGSKASHGCVRLSVEDAKWIYNNCPAGTTIVVY